MGTRKSNKDKLDILFFKNIDPFFEVPIFIDGHMTEYTINILGNVTSYTGYYGPEPYILKPVITSNGYCHVTITYDGKQYVKSIHRLVAGTFLPNINCLPEVNHKDGNKERNYVWNLEWCTPQENIQHAFKTGLKQGKKGSEHPCHRITDEVALRICEMLASGNYTYDDIAKKTGASYTIVKKIKNRVRWTHISKNYDFSNYTRKNSRG